MTWTQRIAGGFAVGAAAMALPFAASPAAASDWVLDSGWNSHATCMDEGEDYINNNGDLHDYTEFKCEKGDRFWNLYVR
ncbi:hypothetical protein IDM40_25230 [Nocardiopsis sp. HNM0947]|uniref:Secreted protein n=1 Tax=Nocardiopsis coralli TaxID=2772213 RepID=A0ABR9PDR7_9ACTN|nr:hypothetical protein [Nocardiopsis coralli]MBE3001973.1 hypothetical protein [Nocardiopsis coralli]